MTKHRQNPSTHDKDGIEGASRIDDTVHVAGIRLGIKCLPRLAIINLCIQGG